MTGLDCAGCGSQRAIHELLHFNFVKAFQHNPLLIFFIPYILAGLVFNFEAVKMRFPKTRKFLFGEKAIYIVLVVIILFSIFRNIF